MIPLIDGGDTSNICVSFIAIKSRSSAAMNGAEGVSLNALSRQSS